MAVRWRLRSFVVPCPKSPLQRSPRPSMSRVEIRCTRWTCPIGCVYAHGMWHVLDIHGEASETVHGNSPSKNPGLSETSSTCRDKSCIRECIQRVKVEVRVPNLASRQSACAGARSLADTLAACARPPSQSHLRLSMVLNRSRRSPRVNMGAASV